MQLRYDGYVGFPGGYVDEGESAEEAVIRELKEEISTDKECFDINSEDHIISHYSPEKNLIVHLYAKEVSLNLFSELEQCSMKGYDYGIEVMGVLRIPLYTMSDNFGGFPSFLQNQFIGNTKEQLCHALIARGIMTEDEVKKALTAQDN
ncbi:U8 snoRNA-decapping enzyme isoform X2 [Halyomorpha halys]|nr:U8 snoRNA-decapping enzyme-like isoform X2 [Halyomorpha halys]